MFSPYGWIAIVIVVASLFGGTYMKGRADGKAHVQAQWDNDKDVRKIAEQAAIAGRLRANEAAAAKVESDKAKEKKEHANEIAKIRADNASNPRLPIHADCVGSTSGGETNSTSGGAATTSGTGFLQETVNSDLFALMQEADEIVASCRVAQKFIVDNGMAP